MKHFTFASLNNYSDALIDLAREEDKFLEYRKMAEILKDTFSENPSFGDILVSVNIPQEEKQKILHDTFGKNLNKHMYSLLFIMMERNLIRKTPLIMKFFLTRTNDILHIYPGTIFSTHKLTSKQITAIEEKVSKNLNQKVTLENAIDESLIGGIRVKVGDIVFDNSTVNRMNRMKQDLINSKEDI